MFTFSNSSMLMSLLFSNILLMILYFIFLNKQFMIDIGHKLLALFIAITVLRFLFPFEIAYSTNINLPKTLSHIIICFKNPFIDIGNYSLSVWHIFLIIWAVGSFIATFRCFLSYRSFHRMIMSLGRDITSEEPYQSMMRKICQKYDKINSFHIVKLYGISSPMITGIRKPYVLIPEIFDVRTQDMYYILRHEAAHFFHHDLLLKFFSELLCVIYWWNPFVVLLKRQIATMLELRIDLQITNSSDPQDQINYLNCLINAAKAAVSNPVSAKSAISLCSTNESLLTQRFFIIMNSSQKKRNRRKQLLFSLLFVGLFFFSIFFIFEPFSIAAKDAEGTFYVTPSTAYLIENPDGTYDFYYKNDFQSTLSHVDEALSNLPIYKMEELQ